MPSLPDADSRKMGQGIRRADLGRSVSAALALTGGQDFGERVIAAGFQKDLRITVRSKDRAPQRVDALSAVFQDTFLIKERGPRVASREPIAADLRRVHS